jgi:hypothetical protein
MLKKVLTLIRNKTAGILINTLLLNSWRLEVSKGVLKVIEQVDGDTYVPAIDKKDPLRWGKVVYQERVKKNINLGMLSEEGTTFLQLWQLMIDLVGNGKIFDRSKLDFTG